MVWVINSNNYLAFAISNIFELLRLRLCISHFITDLSIMYLDFVYFLKMFSFIVHLKYFVFPNTLYRPGLTWNF